MIVNDIRPSEWHPPVYIISGEQGEGKTTFLLEILGILTENYVKISGVAAPGYFQHGIRSGFSVLDLATGKSEELCSVKPSFASKKHGCYYFRSEAISFGCRALLKPMSSGQIDLLVIDEVGRFELEGAIWADCIDHIVGTAYPPMIWTVRCSLIKAVSKRWPVTKKVIFRVGSVRNEEFISDIMKEIIIYRSYKQGYVK